MSNNGRQRAVKGFTLVELMITVVVIAVLTAIAYPTYAKYVYKTRRAEATRTLLELRGQMERYYADRETYVGATLAALMVDGNTTAHAYYTLSIEGLTASSYTLQATPAGTHAEDGCGTFTLTSTGVKKTVDGSLDSSKCW